MAENENTGENLAEKVKRKFGKNVFEAPMNAHSKIKHVYGIVSGKGGVGKSLVTSMLAVKLSKMGKKVAILDADITGPSIPKSFGITEHAFADEEGMNPVLTKTGIEVMSINLILPDEESPVIWRGPAIAGTVKQFWSDVKWGDIDYMFVDMPPGTGDVPLTVFQSLPVEGIFIVTSPQELVSMIVSKAVNMADRMKINTLGIIENYSYAICPDCGKHIEIFGKSHVQEAADKYGLPVLENIPIDTRFALAADKGEIEDIDIPYLGKAIELINE